MNSRLVIRMRVLLSAAAAAALASACSRRPPPPARVAARATAAAPAAAEAAPAPEAAASNAFAVARAWAEANPARDDEAAARAEAVAAQFKGTAAAAAATVWAAERREARRQAAGRALDALNRQAEALERKGELAEALALVERYEGPFADETRDAREAACERLRARLEESRQRSGAAFDQALAALLTQGVKEAAALVREQGAAPGSAGPDDAWRQLADALARAERLGETIQKSFQAQSGQEVAVELKSGSRRLLLAGAEAGAFLFSDKVGQARLKKRVAFSELSEAELRARAGEDAAGLYVYRVAALAANREYEAAKPYAAGLPPPLRDHLAQALDQALRAGASDAAWGQLVSALARAGVDVRGAGAAPDKLLAALQGSTRSAGMNLLLHAAAKDLALQYRGSEWLKDKGVVRVVNSMLALKPEADAAAPAASEPTDPPDAAPAATDDKSVDWKKEIDF